LRIGNKKGHFPRSITFQVSRQDPYRDPEPFLSGEKLRSRSFCQEKEHGKGIFLKTVKKQGCEQEENPCSGSMAFPSRSLFQ
jgi:hypothetical protein